MFTVLTRINSNTYNISRTKVCIFHQVGLELYSEGLLVGIQWVSIFLIVNLTIYHFHMLLSHFMALFVCQINCVRGCVINLIIKVIQVKNNLLKISKEVVKGQNTILTISV